MQVKLNVNLEVECGGCGSKLEFSYEPSGHLITTDKCLPCEKRTRDGECIACEKKQIIIDDLQNLNKDLTNESLNEWLN